MILAAVIVRCPSNGHSDSSTSGLLAPTAQSSVGRVACSCLPWLALWAAGVRRLEVEEVLRPLDGHRTITAARIVYID